MIRMKNSVLRFDVLSLFPKTIEGFTEESILGKAIERGFLEINSIDLRRWSKGKHREADDRPCGGGAGMVLSRSHFSMRLRKFPMNQPPLCTWHRMVSL